MSYLHVILYLHFKPFYVFSVDIDIHLETRYSTCSHTRDKTHRRSLIERQYIFTRLANKTEADNLLCPLTNDNR